MGGCQHYGPFSDPYYNMAPNILGYPEKDDDFDNHPYAQGRRSSPNLQRLLSCHRRQEASVTVPQPSYFILSYIKGKAPFNISYKFRPG